MQKGVLVGVRTELSALTLLSTGGGWCNSSSVWSVALNVRPTNSNYRTVICKKLSIPCTTAWLFMTHMTAWWCLTKGRLSSTLIPDGC
jgi:hypothetical protein